MQQKTRWKRSRETLEELVQQLRSVDDGEKRGLLEGEIHRQVVDHLIIDVAERFPALDHADAEEIVSDALLMLFLAPHRFDPSRASVVTYLRMVVRRDAQNLVSRHQRGPTLLPLESLDLERTERSAGTAASASVQTDLAAQVEQMVSQLPARTRQAMRLALRGMTPAEIAGELECEPGTVRTRLSRGIRTVRERLNRPSPR